MSLADTRRRCGADTSALEAAVVAALAVAGREGLTSRALIKATGATRSAIWKKLHLLVAEGAAACDRGVHPTRWRAL